MDQNNDLESPKLLTSINGFSDEFDSTFYFYLKSTETHPFDEVPSIEREESLYTNESETSNSTPNQLSSYTTPTHS